MSQMGHSDQNPKTPSNSIGHDLAVRYETDTGVSDTVATRDFDTADRQKLNLGVDTPCNVDSVTEHMAGDSISSQVQEEIETAHDDWDVNHLTHDALGETQTVADEINVTGVVGSELIDDNARSSTDEVNLTRTGDNATDRLIIDVANGSGNQLTVNGVLGETSAALGQAEINDLQDTDLTAVKAASPTAVAELTDRPWTSELISIWTHSWPGRCGWLYRMRPTA